MAITDKTRKILWGRAGNRCAICRRELVVERKSIDDEAVVGEECHIISEQPTGPRHLPDFPSNAFDDVDNLLLLCRVDHKMVDDRVETYSSEWLRQKKAEHEAWVRTSLEKTEPEAAPIRIRRLSENIPRYLTQLTSGREVLNLLAGICSGVTEHDELNTEDEADLIASFLNEAIESGEMAAELGPAEQVRARFCLTASLHQLEADGFLVLGAREIQRIEGGVGGARD